MDHIRFSNMRDSDKASDYIPSKCANNRCLKMSLVIGGIISGLLIIAVIATVLHLTNNGGLRKSNATYESPMELVLSGGNRLLFFDIKNKTVYDYDQSFSYDAGIGTFEVHGRNNYFWHSVNRSIIFHHKNYLHGEIFTDPRVKVQDMAYDHIDQLLYVTDKAAGSLIVIDLQTTFYHVLLGDLIRPHHIQVDPQQSLMFILQESDSILKGNMDGTSLQKIIKGEHLTAMTIDTKTQKIFWADQGSGIESSDYEGNNRQVFSMDTANIIDLAIVDKDIYWLWEEHIDDLPRHRLVSCRIDDEICGDHSVTDLEHLGSFGSIKATPINRKRDPSARSSCSKEDNGCEHFCLPSSGGKYRCACHAGWQLDLDLKKCRKVQQFLLYSSDNYFRGRFLDTIRNFSVDAIMPAPYKSNGTGGISFDYDILTDSLYFSDEKNIYLMNLMANQTDQTVLLRGDNDTHIKDIAFDWTIGNVYFLEKRDNVEGYKVKMMNVRLGSAYIKTLRSSNTSLPDSMEIHPKLGYLTFDKIGDLDEGWYIGTVHVSTANGTEVKALKLGMVEPGYKSLAIDFTDERFYFIHREYTGHVTSLNFNGTDVKNVGLGLYPIRGISVHRKYLYINNHHEIYRFDKADSMKKVKLVPILNDCPHSSISAVRIVSEPVALSTYIANHPCREKNGGCQQFCFLHDKKAVCECRDGEINTSITMDRVTNYCQKVSKQEESKKEATVEKEPTKEEAKKENSKKG